MHNLCVAEDAKINAYQKWREKDAEQEQDELQQIGESPCNFCGLDGCLASLLEKKLEIQSSSPLYQIVLIIMNTCSTKMLQFPPITCHAPTPQYIVLFIPCHSQGTHRPSEI